MELTPRLKPSAIIQNKPPILSPQKAMAAFLFYLTQDFVTNLSQKTKIKIPYKFVTFFITTWNS